MLRKRQKGFTLIELLIVVAIIAIIAAIAIPNLLTALQKGRQKRTMGDMKTIATGLESYDVDNAMYPNVNNFNDLPNHLSPFYIANFPRKDGWNNSFAYQTAQPFDVYSLISFGRDRKELGGRGAPQYGQTYPVEKMSDFDTDIYLSNGQFTWAPKQ